MLRIYNSLSKRVETFKPLDKKLVRLYTCGPTVYSRQHLGNYRTYLWEDALKRYLAFSGYKVMHSMNITDFDNTVMKEMRKTGINRKRLTAKYEALFRQNLSALGALPADRYPHVSQYAEKMADRVLALLKAGLAYKDGRGRVFFDVSKYKKYGELSGRRLHPAERKVAREEYKRFQAGDFLLWNPCKKGDEGCGECFQSKLGAAHPAWNLHCAVMSTETLGNRIDIAMGGKDNIFNHHENTRAIASGLSHAEYAKYWMHIRHLIIDGEKMSKSKGNVLLLSDMLKRGFRPRQVRFVLLSVHYRKRLNFTWEYANKMRKRYAALGKLIGAMKKQDGAGSRNFDKLLNDAKWDFQTAVDDDLDVPAAVAGIERFLSECAKARISKKQAGRALSLLGKFDTVLAFLPL